MSRKPARNWEKSRRHSGPMPMCSPSNSTFMPLPGNGPRRRKLRGRHPAGTERTGRMGFDGVCDPAETGGGIPQARAILIQAQRTFPKEQIIAYNLACYDCQFGDLDAAKAWFQKACVLGDAHKIKQMALQDPDLKPCGLTFARSKGGSVRGRGASGFARGGFHQNEKCLAFPPRRPDGRSAALLPVPGQIRIGPPWRAPPRASGRRGPILSGNHPPRTLS